MLKKFRFITILKKKLMFNRLSIYIKRASKFQTNIYISAFIFPWETFNQKSSKSLPSEKIVSYNANVRLLDKNLEESRPTCVSVSQRAILHIGSLSLAISSLPFIQRLSVLYICTLFKQSGRAVKIPEISQECRFFFHCWYKLPALHTNRRKKSACVCVCRCCQIENNFPLQIIVARRQ